ncbi:MAG: AI-2E family transporter, partial [Ferruginibacter sp.]
YRHTIRNFFFAVFTRSHKSNVHTVLNGTKLVIKSYMTGLIIEMVIIATCNTIILMLIGIKYAVFLGVLTGVLNIMPFIGIYAGMIFTALVSLTTSASMSQIVWIFIGLLCMHFVDTNFIMPRIVGSRVKINALIAILGSVVGGILIGIPGVFFALPTVAILKIIFDTTEELKPWGILLGDDSEPPVKKMVRKINKKILVKKPEKILPVS